MPPTLSPRLDFHGGNSLEPRSRTGFVSLPGHDELRKKVEEYHVKASDLAREAGLSKSVVSKILNMKCDPSYSKVLKLWTALEKLHEERLHGRGPDAVEGRIPKEQELLTAEEDEETESVKRTMGEKFDQLPVIRSGRLVGMVTRKSIRKAKEKAWKNSRKRKGALRVKDAMSSDYVALEPNEPAEKARRLLDNCQAVIVVRDGKPIGILTEADFD